MIFVCTTVAGLARVEKLNYSVLYMVGSADGTVQNSFQQKTTVNYMYVFKQIVYNHARVRRDVACVQAVPLLSNRVWRPRDFSGNMWKMI